MKMRMLFILLTVMLATSLCVAVTRGQSSGFVINGALANTNLGMSPSPEFNTLLPVVSPRFVVQTAQALHHQNMNRTPNELESLVQQVGSRFVMQFALANRFYSINYPTAVMEDVTAPQVSQIAAARTGATTVRITWTTDEFATGAVEFGTSPGAYTQSQSDPLLYKNHSINLGGIAAGATVYYRIRGTDRSGNPYQTAEYSFTDAPPPATATNTPAATPVPTIVPPTNTPIPTAVATPITDPVGQDAHRVFMPAVRRP